MNCEDVNDLLDEYINGETDNAVSSEIEAHIRTCENCRMQYEELKSLKAELASLAEPLPNGFEERLLARLRRTRLKRLLCTGIPGIGAAAAILLVCVVIGGRGGYKYLDGGYRELSDSVVQSEENNDESAESGGTQGGAAEGSDTEPQSEVIKHSTDEAHTQAKAADTEAPQADSYDAKTDNIQAEPQNTDVRTAPDDSGIADTGNAKNSTDGDTASLGTDSAENFTQALNNASGEMNGTEPSASKMRIGSAAAVTAPADESIEADESTADKSIEANENTADKSIEADENTAELFEAEEYGMPMPRASGGGSSAPRMEQAEEKSADVIFTCDTDSLSEIADKLEDMPQVSFTYRDDARIDIHCEGIKYAEIKALLEETGAKQTYADVSADELSCDVSIKAARQQ